MEEEGKSQENKSEINLKKNEQIVSEPEILPVTTESIKEDLNKTEVEIEKQDMTIATTISEVDRSRKELNLPGQENDIPSIKPNKKNVEELKSKRDMLKQRLSEIVHESNVAHKYSEDLISIAEEKINWVNSEEFARRLKLTGVSDEKVAEARSMILENINSGQPIILPRENFEEVKTILAELSGSENIKLAAGFHVDKAGTPGVPKYLDKSIVLEEKFKPAMPPIPGQERGEATKYVDTENMSHEMGHLAQDGLLREENYNSINLQTKEGSPDPKYVGDILETDTRIRGMFRDLSGVFDPQKETLTQQHLDLLRSRSVESKGTKELFDHYDDETLIKLANELPAI